MSGIVPFSGSLNICSEASGFSELFPALGSRVLVAASSCFLVPGFRDLLLTHGVLDCSRFNCEEWIQEGHSLFVFPGGAREGLYANPDCDWLDLRRRLGFIRLAIRYNVPVVPSYTFNEVNAFTQVAHPLLEQSYPWIHRFRQGFQRTVGIAAPFFCHLLPKRNTAQEGGVTVVGKPLHFSVHTDTPTDEEVDTCLHLYIAALQALYEEHAPRYNAGQRFLSIT
jgi:2-acylglycerol O-acyltransferase 2